MKNKKNIKILLPVVILIWGLFLYKLLGALNPDTPLVVSVPSTNYEIDRKQVRDTFSLLPIEKDPFLGIATTSKPGKVRSTKVTKKESLTPWPAIRYLGSVTDDQGKSAVFVVTVNEEQLLLKRGEQSNDVLLIKGDESSVTLKFQGESQKFMLQ